MPLRKASWINAQRRLTDTAGPANPGAGPSSRDLRNLQLKHRGYGKALLFCGSSLIALSALPLTLGPALAGCSGDLPPGNQDDIVTCTGAAPDPYQPPSTLENGRDTINLDGGTANGSISGGGGADIFNLTGATVNGTLFGGESSTDQPGRPTRGPQPNLIDTFNLDSGAINAPASGDAIVAERGDDIIMIGGAVVVTGNVSGGRGADRITITGGRVNGIVSGEGTLGVQGSDPSHNDIITWSDGFVDGVFGDVGNDLAIFRDLTSAHLPNGLPVEGGTENDRLLWDSTRAGDVERYVNWELFELTNGSQLTFSSTLTLGDSGTGTGTLTIDPTSAVFAGDGAHAIVPFTDGQLAQVNNAGAIDLTSGPVATTDSLTITGNYVGESGQLLLHTFLGTDDSPSDELVISSGTGSGTTSILVTNVDGPGALTLANGIRVVDAINGATTTGDAFTLGGPAAAGPFEYLLFRGGVTPSTETDNDWFLRNTTAEILEPPPIPPGRLRRRHRNPLHHRHLNRLRLRDRLRLLGHRPRRLLRGSRHHHRHRGRHHLHHRHRSSRSSARKSRDM